MLNTAAQASAPVLLTVEAAPAVDARDREMPSTAGSVAAAAAESVTEAEAEAAEAEAEAEYEAEEKRTAPLGATTATAESAPLVTSAVTNGRIV